MDDGALGREMRRIHLGGQFPGHDGVLSENVHQFAYGIR
jgi:hypothetical protein